MNRENQKTWAQLSHGIVLSRRELLLGIAACTLAGILVGMVLSPRKTVTIASNNGNTNSGNTAAPPQQCPTSPCEEVGAE